MKKANKVQACHYCNHFFAHNQKKFEIHLKHNFIILLINHSYLVFVVSYVMIVAFHPALQLNRFIIYRSFAHTLDQLSNIDYLTQEQIGFIDNYLIHMLKDCANEVSKRQCKNGLGQMFSVESALVKKTLLKWFNTQFKRPFTEIKAIAKIRLEAENKINWQKDRCVICKFPMRLEPNN